MRGFTLIEMMMALAIVAVLSAIALPGYQGVIHRFQRTDARLALLWIQAQQERHYAANNLYGPVPGLPGRSTAGDYELSLSLTNSGQGYVAMAQAAANGRQASDLPCRWFSINEVGERSSATSAGIWSRDDANRCWS